MAAVETGSLTGAATLCHISHAGIANGLNELERGMGTQLLLRQKSKGVIPTAAGRALLPLARNMLRGATDIERLGQSGQGELTGELALSCTLALSPALIPLIASAFAELHPKVDLVFHEGNGREVLQMVRDGKVDAGLAFQRQLSGDLEYLGICPIRVKVALPPTHPLASRPSISLRELADEPAITPDGPALESMLKLMREAGVEPNVRWTFTSPETIRAMVARGFGYSLLYIFPPASTSDSSSVVAVPLNDQIPDNAMVMALPTRRRRIDKVDKLAEILHSDAVTTLFG